MFLFPSTEMQLLRNTGKIPTTALFGCKSREVILAITMRQLQYKKLFLTHDIVDPLKQ